MSMECQQDEDSVNENLQVIAGTLDIPLIPTIVGDPDPTPVNSPTETAENNGNIFHASV